MRKRALALFIVMLFVLPIPLSFVQFQSETNPGGSNLQNVTELVKDPVLSYDEKQTKHTACGGDRDSHPFIDGDYWDTWEDDASYLEADSSFYTGINLVFNITENRPIGEISFFLRWQVVLNPGPDPTLNWMIYNFDDSSYDTVYSVLLETTLNFEDREESITYDEKYVNATNHVKFYVYSSNQYADDITVDYAYMTVTKEYDGEFRETLPDDVLYYPDPLRHTACGGNLDSEPFHDGDYWDTWEDDASYLEADSSFSVGINLVFNTTEYANFIVDNATLSIFLRWQVVLQGGGDVPELYWAIWDFDDSSYDTIYSMILGTTLNFEDREVSITYDEKYVNATNHVRFIVYSNSTYADDITVDYAYLTATNDYTESFADVSDWTLGDEAGAGSYSISSNGDLGRINKALVSAANEFIWYYTNFTTDITVVDKYLEIRYSIDEHTKLYFQIWDGSGSWINIINGELGATAINTKMFYLGSYGFDNGTINSMRMYLDDKGNALTAPDELDMYIDYIGIGTSTEMGWQHDGSTTECVVDEGSVGWTFDKSSDGDILQLNWTRASGVDSAAWQEILIDPTSTSAELNLDYYPFWALHWRVTEATNASLKHLQVYTDDTRLALTDITATDEITSWSTMRYNLKASTDTGIAGNSIRLYCGNTEDTATFSLEIEWTKFYSIANYTVTESSTTTDDVLYVEGGILHSTMDNGSFILDYDPTFFLNGSYSWTKYSSLGESYLSYLHGGWTSYSNETTGNLYAGTTTGLRIKFNETANIQKIEYSVLPPQWHLIATAIIYFDMPNWWVIAIADAVFYIPIGELTLQFLLMIMGLVMIPFSTLYLVKGGRDEMNRDKLYFFLLLFLIGWALVLGGLM